MVRKLLADSFAGLTQAVLDLFVGQAELLGDVTNLQAVVDVEAVDASAGFRQSGQCALHALDELVGRDDGFHFADGIGVFREVVLVFIPDATTAIVVGNAVARHGVDEAGQG